MGITKHGDITQNPKNPFGAPMQHSPWLAAFVLAGYLIKLPAGSSLSSFPGCDQGLEVFIQHILFPLQHPVKVVSGEQAAEEAPSLHTWEDLAMRAQVGRDGGRGKNGPEPGMA